ncbi:MAG: hypothetical protein OXI26_11625 [bacterium]|nr:hypothetical protein [bacterium]
MPRLFVAVWPPGDALDALVALPRPPIPGLRWTDPRRLHVTMRFLGDADEEAALAALGGERFPAARVTLGPGVERLGRGVLVVPAGGLEDLAAAVVAATAHLGQPPPHRPFAGHVTVARYRGKPPAGYAPPISAAFRATEIALVSSDPPGTYHTVATFALHEPASGRP